MQSINRRRMLIAVAAAAPGLAGCDTDSVQEAIDSAETDTLETGSLALRGFAIVAYVVGTRVVTLPTPGVRILGVFLIITSLTTKLAIEYLDVELKKRYVAKELDESEQRQVESDLAVTFQLENGQTESVPLGPNQYESDESDESNV